MAYFQRRRDHDQDQYTRKFASVAGKTDDRDHGEDDPNTWESDREYDPEEEIYAEDSDFVDWDETYSDDDSMEEDPSDGEWTEEELAEEKKRKFRIAAGIGDFVAILAGTAVILVLAAFLISMIQFVSSDLAQNFTIWATKF